MLILIDCGTTDSISLTDFSSQNSLIFVFVSRQSKVNDFDRRIFRFSQKQKVLSNGMGG